VTKRVRIENADTSNFRVVVQVYDKSFPVQQEDGSSVTDPDVLVKEIPLNHPTAMTGDECYLTSSRYIVIKELPPA
jgi:hypothetical protein